MKWHRTNKYIIRKLVISVGIVLAMTLFTQNMLCGEKYIAPNPLIKVFTQEYFFDAIYLKYNMVFALIMLVGPILLYISGKDYERNYKSGVIRYICGIAILCASITSFVLTTLLVLKVYSFGIAICGVVALALLVLVIANIIYYKKNKDILVNDNNKFSVGSIVVICLVFIGLGGMLAKEYSSVRKECYEEFRDRCYRRAFDTGFLDINGDFKEEERNYHYTYLQYVNLFNKVGKSYTYDELKTAIEDFKNDGDQWYVLWDLCYMNSETYGYGDEITESDWYAFVDFADYGVDKFDKSRDFLVLVRRELRKKGTDVEDATFEQIDEACNYVYSQYYGHENPIILGDEEGEVKVTIDISQSKLVKEIKPTREGEGYFVELDSWYEVSAAGEEKTHNQDRSTELESGKIYKTSLLAYSHMEYIMAGNMLIDMEGIGCTLLEVRPSVYGGTSSKVDIWIKVN